MKKVYIITKGEVKNVLSKTNILKENILSYRTTSNKGKERGSFGRFKNLQEC